MSEAVKRSEANLGEVVGEESAGVVLGWRRVAAIALGVPAARSLGLVHSSEGGRCPHARSLLVLPRPIAATRFAAGDRCARARRALARPRGRMLGRLEAEAMRTG